MTAEQIYQRAWALLLEKIMAQPRMRWSSTRLQELMLQCLIDAGRKEKK